MTFVADWVVNVRQLLTNHGGNSGDWNPCSFESGVTAEVWMWVCPTLSLSETPCAEMDSNKSQ